METMMQSAVCLLEQAAEKLDVYKSQPRCRLIASWSCSRFQGLGCSPIKAVRAVSYTHLDVYKRQQEYRLFDM